jgi:soluble lytic murein transglycosylase-like protein
VKYDPEVRAAIAHWGPALGVSISPALVHAVIEKESTHGHKLVTDEPGGHHSYGPMMVLDTTATNYGVGDPATLQAPALGIWYGVRNLAEMLKTFRGDVAAAVSAYNTGPSRAHRNAAGKFPNQAYVNKVLLFWRVYGGAAGAMVVLAIVGAALWRARRRRAA